MYVVVTRLAEAHKVLRTVCELAHTVGIAYLSLDRCDVMYTGGGCHTPPLLATLTERVAPQLLLAKSYPLTRGYQLAVDLVGRVTLTARYI
jgi:hypothetical protein